MFTDDPGRTGVRASADEVLMNTNLMNTGPALQGLNMPEVYCDIDCKY